MSLSILYSDTATNPVTPGRNVPAFPINYNANWRVITEKPGEVSLTNISADLRMPEKVRIAFSEISDIFKGSDLEPVPSEVSAGIYPQKKGASILIQTTGAAVDDVTGNAYPYSAHLVLKIPMGAPDMTTDVVYTIIGRLLGHLYETGDGTTSDRVAALLRGSLTPTDV